MHVRSPSPRACPAEQQQQQQAVACQAGLPGHGWHDTTMCCCWHGVAWHPMTWHVHAWHGMAWRRVGKKVPVCSSVWARSGQTKNLTGGRPQGTGLWTGCFLSGPCLQTVARTACRPSLLLPPTTTAPAARKHMLLIVPDGPKRGGRRGAAAATNGHRQLANSHLPARNSLPRAAAPLLPRDP